MTSHPRTSIDPWRRPAPAAPPSRLWPPSPPSAPPEADQLAAIARELGRAGLV